MKVPSNFLEVLKSHKECALEDVNKVRDKTHKEIEVSTDEEIIRIRRMVGEVVNERHKMRGFVRLKHVDKMSYGYMNPTHDIGEKVTDIFARRFPGVIIVLGNEEESWVAVYTEDGYERSRGPSLNETVNKLKDMMKSDREQDISEIWGEYYGSQYTEERKNKKLFEKNMPQKHMESAGLKVEKKFGNMSLDDF